jgi:hypothetical protein
LAELLNSLVQVMVALGELLWEVVSLLAPWSLLIAWIAWWLWAVNWKRAWAALADGAWAPVVLLMILVARVWASLDASEVNLFYIMTVPSFWWQLGAVGLVVGLTLFCGWLQIALGWGPVEINLEPPPVASAHH